MLVNDEPASMIRIRNGSCRLSVKRRSRSSIQDGERWFRNGAINISPKFGTMKVRFDLPKPSEIIGFSKFGELSSILRESRRDGGHEKEKGKRKRNAKRREIGEDRRFRLISVTQSLEDISLITGFKYILLCIVKRGDDNRKQGLS